MKKAVALLFIFALAFSLWACASNQNDSSEYGNHSNVLQSDASKEMTSQEDGNALVVYFSCTGNTELLAKEIAAQTGADLYEIVPEQPYTMEDIDYQNDDCRANREMKDSNVRPAISGKIENLSEYEILYVGYPIWWGTMPRILNTFFDMYDFSGKTIRPFCTSGGSGIAESISAIRDAEPGANIGDGLRISSGAVDDCTNAVSVWLQE